MDIAAILKVGAEYGLDGQLLADFLRDERAAQREAEREKLAAAEREKAARMDMERMKQAAEEREAAAQAEMDKLRLEIEEKDKQRKHELEVINARQNVEQNQGAVGGQPQVKSIKPKIPPFDDAKEQIDAYIHRFERYADAQKWDKSTWATSLSALLKGEALNVYYRLPAEDYDNYDAIKTALLKRYQLTEQGFKEKFRKAYPEHGESFTQFITRIDMYFQRWIELSGIEKDFDQLRDLLLREQALNVASKDLKVFLQERKPKNAKEMGTLAEQYLEVHGKLYDMWHTQNKSQTSGSHQPKKDNKDNKTDQTKSGNKSEGKSSTYDEDKLKKNCFICHRQGHYAKDCKFKKKKDRPEDMTAMQAMVKESDMVTLENGWQVPVMVKDGVRYIKTKEGEMKCALSLNQHCVPQVVGKLEGYGMVSVVRDTGCTGVIVKKDLCSDECFTGAKGSCTMVDGSVTVAPFVVIDLDTPFFKGRVKAMAMDSPIFDVIIGNIVGARDASNPDPFWRPVISTKDDHAEGEIESAENENQLSQSRKAEGFDDSSQSGQTDKMSVRSDGIHSDNGENQLSDEFVSNDKVGCKNTLYDDDATSKEVHSDNVVSASVITRSRAKARGLKPLIVAQPDLVKVDKKQLVDLQRQDQSLCKVRTLVDNPVEKNRCWQERYLYDDDVLYREHTSSEKTGRRVTNQLVLPKLLREGVIEVAHDSILGGHLGTQKTLDRVLSNFYWPGINGDVKRFCASCDKCQRTTPRGRTSRVPLGSTPMIDEPFARVAIDLVGPLPVSNNGYRYILTLIDYATRYPEAIALKKIETTDVAEALISIFSRVGLPREILHDQGTQFTGGLMTEIARLLSIKKLTTTPYHAMANGLVEKWNGTLKLMLKRMCEERPKDWDRYLPALLFAYREVPQDSLGFSPFEMLYGRSVRGPMMLLREIWAGCDVQDEVRSTYQYVLELRDRLEETCILAQEALRKSKIRQKFYYDKKARNRSFKAGDQVLLLLPTDNNKLIMHWKGPFTVLDRVAHNDYRIDINGKSRVFHANMLKLYICRNVETTEDSMISAQAVVTMQEEDEEQCSRDMMFCPTNSTETWKDGQVNEKLGDDKKEEVWNLIKNYSSVFTDCPGKTDLLECHIDVFDDVPVRQRPYPVPFAIRESMKAEVENMEKLGVIEESQSDYCSPSVIVRKPDGSHRYCIDFRKLNALTVLDSEPIPNQEAIIAKLGKCKFFTKFDLSKGFWQIPIATEHRHRTAFATERGLRQFVTMPFGLVNASSVFCRMMRKLLDGINHAESYIDDLVIYTDSWEQHLAVLQEVLDRLKLHNLTARPSKCFIGFQEINFLGQNVGQGIVKPQEVKINKILNVQRPQTKKELRSYIGMISYHRKFIQSFADQAKPLTDMLGKGQPSKLKWSYAAEKSFQFFRQALSKPPVLQLPDMDKDMVLAVDSSGTGIGGVLMQEHEGMLRPVMYISRKLKPAETRYSAIERECLALVWAVKTLHPFLYGKDFVLLSDHQPLMYLNSSKMNNSRVMRWALDLQVYRFTVKVIKGVDNCTADYLSRCGKE